LGLAVIVTFASAIFFLSFSEEPTHHILPSRPEPSEVESLP